MTRPEITVLYERRVVLAAKETKIIIWILGSSTIYQMEISYQ